jgi:hypothetical protein
VSETNRVNVIARSEVVRSRRKGEYISILKKLAVTCTMSSKIQYFLFGHLPLYGYL